jgi:hypothetical protein
MGGDEKEEKETQTVSKNEKRKKKKGSRTGSGGSEFRGEKGLKWAILSGWGPGHLAVMRAMHSIVV